MKKMQKPEKPKKPQPNWMFPPITRPTYTDDIRFPEDLTKLPSHELGRYHGRYVGLHAYASSELAKINVKVLKTESEISRVRSQRFLMLANAKMPKWQLEIQLDAGVKIAELRKELLKIQVQKEKVLSYMLNFERYSNALSREMSRRASEARLS